MSNRLKFSIFLIAVVILLSVPTQAQIVFGQPASGDAGFVFSSWNLDISTIDTATNDVTVSNVEISQSVVPLRGFVPLAENTEALIYVATSGNQLKGDSAVDYSLSGMSDVRIQVSRSLADDQVLLSLGLNLPTGKKKLNLDEEVAVLNYLAADYISLPLRRFGEGLGFSLLLGTARMVGDWRTGASVQYRYNGKYDPYEGVTEFDPGDLISFNLGVDRAMEAMSVSAEVGYSLCGSDKLDGANIYKQSTVLNLHAGVNWKNGANRIAVGAGYLARGRNTIYVADTTSEAKIFGNELWMRGTWARDFGPDWRVTPTLELRNIAENEQDLGSATIVGLGTTVARRLSDQVGFDIGGRYFTGTANGGDIDVSGYQIRLGLTANL